MSELRWHPFHREWIITATHRQDRTFFPPDNYCPLCPTRAGGFPTEIPRESYDIAVFENKFPSLKTPPPDPAIEGTTLAPVRASHGVCEVVCYTDKHDTTLADLPLIQIQKLTRVWQDRFRELIHQPNVEYVFIFENKGKEIGVTLTHPHGQIYAYPFIPEIINIRHEAEKEHFDEFGEQLAQRWLQEEIADGRRIVEEFDEWIALVPFFARYPYEVHIVPKSQVSSLMEMEQSHLDGLANALKATTERYDRLFDFSMPYIMSIFQHPAAFTRFTIEFTPPFRTKDKLKYLAGSEAGCGVFINDTLPEQTAQLLREA